MGKTKNLHTPGGKPVKLVNPPSTEVGLMDSGGDQTLQTTSITTQKTGLAKAALDKNKNKVPARLVERQLGRLNISKDAQSTHSQDRSDTDSTVSTVTSASVTELGTVRTRKVSASTQAYRRRQLHNSGGVTHQD